MLKHAYMLQRSKNYLFCLCPCAKHTSAKGEVYPAFFASLRTKEIFVMFYSFKTQIS